MAALDKLLQIDLQYVRPRQRPVHAARCRLACSGAKYYWRVRAMNEKGIWGPWSSTWSFTPRGPAAPIQLTLSFDSEHSQGTLRWKPNPKGRKPAKYRVYGSDEKGFSISDEPHTVRVGVSKQVPAKRPANFIAEVEATEAAVIGAQVKLAQRESSLLPRRRRRRAWQAERAVRFRGSAPANHLFASRYRR